MKCLCQSCGKKIKSQELCFDFTEFIHGILTDRIKSLNADSEVLKGLDLCFSDWKEESKPFLYSEEKLWELVDNGEGDARNVPYTFPYREIISRMGKKDDEREDFWNWMEVSGESLSQFEHRLWFMKTGEDDADIRFDKVKTADGKIIAEKRLCPKCGGVMSYWSGRYEEICLAVLGGPRVSKSTTLTACAYAFMNEEESIVWEGHKEDEEWQVFKEKYLNKYADGLKVEPTDTVQIPKISFRVTLKNQNKKYVLTFIDLPGEFNDEKEVKKELYEQYTEFFKNIDFVWYCTDPGEVLQLAGDANSNEDIRKLGYAEDKGIINSESLIANMMNLAPYFHEVPTAYILGKSDSDVISEADREEYHLFMPENEDQEECKVLDVQKFFDESDKVRRYIQKYNKGVLRNFQENFRNRCYIAISAYGYTPDQNIGRQTLTKRPYHCRLPFLWMLAVKGFLDIRASILRKRRFKPAQFEEVEGRLGNLGIDEKLEEGIRNNLLMHGDSMTID